MALFWLKNSLPWHFEAVSIYVYGLNIPSLHFHVYLGDILIFGILDTDCIVGFNGPTAKTIREQVGSSQLAHLPWTTMGLFPVLLCITNTCSMTAIMAGGEVHRPSAVQQDIWNWVTLCSWPDCRRTCRETIHGLLIWSVIWWVFVMKQLQKLFWLLWVS